jgi:hypothetical protein
MYKKEAPKIGDILSFDHVPEDSLMLKDLNIKKGERFVVILVEKSNEEKGHMAFVIRRLTDKGNYSLPNPVFSFTNNGVLYDKGEIVNEMMIPSEMTTQSSFTGMRSGKPDRE